jgi:hypothetical protein
MSDKEPASLPSSVSVRYENSPDHRVVHADGVVTSITPNLEFQARFYESLLPVPLSEIHAVTPEGGLKEPESVSLDGGIVRQINVSVVLNPVTVIRMMRTWRQLLDHLKEMGNERIRAAIEQAEASESSKV